MATPEEDFVRFRDGGDAQALGRVFDRLAPELLIVAAHVARDAHAAEDLLQTTFLHAIRGADRYEPRRPLLPWLIGILVHLALQERGRARAPDAMRLRSPQAEDPAVTAQAHELAEALAHAVAGLPRPYRRTLTLRLAHGLSTSEIAHALGCPPATVKTRLQRGLQLLRRALPSGLLAPVVAMLTLGRGLAAVRTEVLRLAEPYRDVVLASGSVLPGAALMKKTTWIVVLVLVSAAAALLVAQPWSRGTAVPAPSAGLEAATGLAGGAARAAPLATTSAPAPLEEAPPAARTAVPAAPHGEDAAGRGSLLVRVRWQQDGRPAAGIRGYVSRSDGTRAPQDDLTGITAADGAFRLAELEPGLVRVGLLRAGLPQECVVEGGRETEVQFELAAGITVEGRVVDDAGRPVAGAGIWLSRARMIWGDIVAASDAQGRFALRGIGDDHYLAARAAGYQPSRFRAIGGADGARCTVELVLPALGSAVEGTVRDAAGRPLAGAVVRAVDGAVPPPCEVHTDDDGRYRIDGLPAGEVCVQARAPDLAPVGVKVEVLAGETASLDLTLVRGATLAGIVRDENGAGIPDAQLHVWCEEAALQASGRTARDGSFVLPALPPGEVSVRASAQGHGETAERLVLHDGEELRWDARLAGGSVLQGQLVDAHDEPLRGWRLCAARAPVRRGGLRLSEVAPSCITDAEGRFRIADTPARAFRLSVLEPGKLFPCHWVDGLQAGREIVVRVPDAARSTATITGVLRDANGGARGSVCVLVSAAATFHTTLASTRSEEGSGRFFLGPLPPGRYAVVIDWDRTVRQRIDEVDLAPAQQLDLGTLRAVTPGRLRTKVVRPGGTATESAKLLLRDGDGALLLSGLGDDVPLRPGEYFVQADAAGAATSQQRITIREGALTEIAIRLQTGVALAMSFALPDSPTAWSSTALELTLHEAQGRAVLFERLQRSGEGFETACAVPPGDYTVHACTDNGAAVRESFTIEDAAGPQSRSWTLR